MNPTSPSLRRMLAFGFIVCLLPIVAATSAAAASADEHTPMSESLAKVLTAGATLTWCGNIPRLCCDDCIGKDIPERVQLVETCKRLNDGWASGTIPTPAHSVIDNTSFNFIHYAADYTPAGLGGSASGCGSCGGSSAPGAADQQMMDLRLERIHRFRDVSENSSFGPGVFSGYDINLRITQKDDESFQVAVFDPHLFTRLLLTDNGSGVFKGASVNHISGLQFYTGGGSTTANPTLAASAVLTTFEGNKYSFDVKDPTGTLPSPWVGGDIGSPASWGNQSYSNSTFHIAGSGTDIWNTADQYGYIYQGMNGDCTITARVASLSTYHGLDADNINGWAKAGVMMRKGLDSNAQTINAFVSGANGINSQSRLTTGGSMTWDSTASGSAPNWVKLQRVGSTITSSYSTNGSSWTTLSSYTVSWGSVIYVGLSLTSHNDGTLSNADFDNVSVAGTAASSGTWPTPTTAPHTNCDLIGRLTSIKDRNNYGIDLTYQTWTSPQLQTSPDLIWEIDHADDSHGRRITYTYNSSQVSGRWVVSSLAMPNGSTVSYSYSGGLLTGISFPDSTSSSFSYTYDSASTCIDVAYDDSGAETTHRRKDAFVTTNFSSAINNRDTYQIFNQASNLVRMVTNGGGEVSYLNIPNTDLVVDIYEGTGRMKEFSKLTNAFTVKMFETWSVSSTTSLSGSLESTYATASYANDDMYRQGTADTVTDERGVTRSLTNDADGFPTTITYSDSTTEVFAYNSFKEITRYKDRLNRVMLYTYDASGNMTKREVGILYSGGSDSHQSEYAHEDWAYNTAGSHIGLLHTHTDFNGNVTTYDYTTTSGAAQYVSTITTPDDAGTGTITAWTFGYDSYGRRISVTDALSREVDFHYDSRDRLDKTTYPDTSNEITVYDTGSTDKNLVVKRKDRTGTETDYGYDSSGRLTSTTIGVNQMDTAGASTAISTTTVHNESLKALTTCAYLDGTNLRSSCVVNGNKTDYTYDFRQRLLTNVMYPNTATSLTTTNLYAANLLRQITDPYGRKTYFDYRSSDTRLVRRVQGLVATDGITDYNAAASIARDTTYPDNPRYLITEYGHYSSTPSLSHLGLDAEGQITELDDPRDIVHTIAYDTRGRTTSRIDAYGSGLFDGTSAGEAAKTGFVYDAQGNVTETRTPRYYDTTDSIGYTTARITQQWTARELIKENKEAPGTSVAGAEDYTYYDDGRLNTTSDRRGKIWTTTWGACCGRIQGKVEPLVGLPDPPTNTNPARITRHNDAGDLSHEAIVNEYSTTTFPTLASPTNQTDIYDNDTVTEATTSYDVRHRPNYRTAWLVKRGTVDANNPPIAGLGGVSSSDGLTTKFRYDDDLTDSYGLSASGDTDSVNPYLSGLNLGTNSAGSAMVEINPAGEKRWTIFDGMGRVIKVVDGNGHATTTAYDVVTSELLVTTVTDANSNSVSQSADGAGRVRIMTDALSKQTTQKFDPNGNLKQVRDPNSVGYDCTYDNRDRRASCTDTHSDAQSWTYDKNGNVLTWVDQRSKTTSYTYDERDRKSSIVDRVSGTTTFTYDPNSDLLTIMDADGTARGDANPTTSYTYDARSTLSGAIYRHDASTTDSIIYKLDAARRFRKRIDQASVTTKYTYDMASRLITRNYNDSSPASSSWDDTFAYDGASRVTSAVSGRYGNTVTRDYTSGSEAAGRLKGETLTIGGTGYTVSDAYDAGNRLTSQTYPNTKVVTRSYTARDQLNVLTYDSSTVDTRSYDDGMRLTSSALGNSLTESRTYRTDNLISTIAIPTNITNFGYDYDETKRKKYETAYPTAEGQNFKTLAGTYGFDDEGRLTAWNRNSTSEDRTWTLSKVGDWTNTATTYPGSTSDTRNHDFAHELKTENSGATTLAYDVKANLTTDENAQTFAWDDENRLTGAQSTTTSPMYSYDALGRRVGKIVDNLETIFAPTGAQVASEYEGDAWTSADIGSPGVAGSNSYANGVVTSAGGGADIWGTADAFRFTYRTLSGDGTIIAKVVTQGNTDAWAKAGVMMRESTAAGSKHVLTAVTPGNGTTVQYRNTTNGTCSFTGGSGSVAIWVKLTRSGNTFAGYTSTDGVTWTSVSSVSVTMNTAIYVGLAVTAHNNATTSTATFTGIRTTGQVYANTAPSIARSYVWGSYVDDLITLVTSGGTKYFPHSNGVYSIAALTDSSGTVQERYRYDAYGKRTILDGAGTTTRTTSSYGLNYGFTGRFHDMESGLVYQRARMYSPSEGRFIGRDPKGYVDGYSLYMAYYVPNVVDPSGSLVVFVHGIGESQHKDKGPLLYQGMLDHWRNTGQPDQAMIHFLYGPAGKWDAAHHRTERNVNAAHELKNLVEKLDDLRREVLKKPCTTREPIYIYAYSNGTTVAYYALDDGMHADGVVFAGASLYASADLKKAATFGRHITSYHSPADDIAPLADGAGGAEGFTDSDSDVTQVEIPGVLHYSDDWTYSWAKDRVYGETEWDSRLMGSLYATNFPSKSNDLTKALPAKIPLTAGPVSNYYFYDSGVK